MKSNDLFNILTSAGITCYAGVPDSTLASLNQHIDSAVSVGKATSIITANEGSAIAYAAGYHLATGRRACVYMQNSGIGNAINPLMSLVHEDVYDIPMVLLIGWRGKPGTKDEPQHKAQGRNTIEMIRSLDIPFLVLNENSMTDLGHDVIVDFIKERKRLAILVPPGILESYSYCDDTLHIDESSLTRRKAINIILDHAKTKDAIIVCSTGKSSRELYELREERGETHDNDFLTVGSMGHTNMIALGIAENTDKEVICIDGDGSCVMHHGNMFSLYTRSTSNLRYIVLNNYAHDSVGGHNTAAEFSRVLIYDEDDSDKFKSASSINGLRHVLDNTASEYIEVFVQSEDTSKLSRPKTTPIENKLSLIQTLQAVRS